MARGLTNNVGMKCRYYIGLPSTTCGFFGVLNGVKFHKHRRLLSSSDLFHGVTNTNDIFGFTRRNARRLFSSSFEPGEKVIIVNNDNDKSNGLGIVKSRAGGWYTVEQCCTDYGHSKKSQLDIIKRRGKDLQKISSSSMAENVESTSNIKLHNATNDLMVLQSSQIRSTDADDEVNRSPVHKEPHIIDLDAACSSSSTSSIQHNNINIKQCKYISQNYTRWIVFSDLHCCPSTLTSCIQVLRSVWERVSNEPNNTGVLFLGDWWHHRGVVRFDCLNAVLAELKSWDRPLIMIPGNHDQIYLEGGEDHGLTPFSNAFTLSNDRTMPGPLILSHPTKFLNTFFIPHVRNITTLEQILASPEALSSDALFIHADVTGAYMNNHIVSQGGVSLSKFPSHRPIYSGHFHKPHLVKAPNAAPGVAVHYVGSPFEISLAEAGQKKALLLLDSTQNWKVVDTFPLEGIGPKHYRFTSMQEFLNHDFLLLQNAANVSETDKDWNNYPPQQQHRVVVSVSQQALADMRNNQKAKNKEGEKSLCPFDAKVKVLRKMGAKVEVREESDTQSTSDDKKKILSSSIPVEDMTPTDVITHYFTEQVTLNRMSNQTATRLLEAGVSLLEGELLNSDTNALMLMNNINPSSQVREIEFQSVTIEGYGSFKDEITYPLMDRGLVLIRGSNLDGGYDSNGSGKTTLAMSILWALTGSLDARPMQDAKVSDVVHQESKFAKVTLEGLINSEKFVITRTKTATRSGLTLLIDGRDLTKQSVKETQSTMEEVLGLSQIFVRSMFWDQHQLNGLLESTDSKLKDELSLIVTLAVWQEASALARTKSRTLSKEVSEIEGMLSVRTEDFKVVSNRLNAAKANLDSANNALQDREQHLRKRIDEQSQTVMDIPDVAKGADIERCSQLLSEASSNVSKLEHMRATMIKQKDDEINGVRARLDKMLHNLNEGRNTEELSKRDSVKAESAYNYAKISLDKALQAWGICDTNTLFDTNMPLVCPTCHAPVDGNFREKMESDITKLQETVNYEQGVKDAALMKELTDTSRVSEISSQVQNLRSEIELKKQQWNEKMHNVEEELAEARSLQLKLSNYAIATAAYIDKMSKLRSIEAETAAALSMLKQNVSIAQGSYESSLIESNNLESTISDLEAKRDVYRNLATTMINLCDAFGPRGIQTFILRNIVMALQTASQMYLDDLSEGQQRLTISLDSGDRITRTSSVRGPDGCWIDRPLSSLSGGQWRRCSLAVTLGFADLVCSKGKLRSSLLVLDEPLMHLDSLGRKKVGGLLRALLQEGGVTGTLGKRTILIILQDLVAEELEEHFDRIDEVRKADGTSSVVIDELNLKL